MNCGLELGQTMTFADSELDEVYKNQISSDPRFGFLLSDHGSLYLFLEFVFPFHQKKFDNQKTCVKAADLPPFFKRENQTEGQPSFVTTESIGLNNL